MFIEIGSYEAKTRLPELLREVQAGQCFTITVGNRWPAWSPVLVPQIIKRQ